MTEPRKIVLILGNGFDIDLNLKTRYEDFWKSKYCPRDYPAPLIKYLNERWGEDLRRVRWYDLEDELISYYRKTRGVGDSFDVITPSEARFIKETSAYDIRLGHIPPKHLSDAQSLFAKHLLIQKTERGKSVYEIPLKEVLLKSTVHRDREAFRLIKEGLCKYLCSIDYSRVNNKSIASAVYYTIASRIKENDQVSIYTFNYTNFPLNGDTQYSAITHHVHGCCADGEIIVGTRDDKEYDEDYDFLQKSFDPHFFPPAIVPDLLDATDVVFFGHSIGENDRQYFGSFFKQQTSNDRPPRMNITIFTFNEDSELEIKRALQKMTDSNLSVLCSQNDLMIIKTNCLKDHHEDYFTFLSKYITNNKELDSAKEWFRCSILRG